jgi:segregation and condensation protein A
MPLQDEYQVTLDSFCGPMDLLLYLIRRAEVDIHDIPIAEITDQYLNFVRKVDDIDIEAAGEFLVVAATLMEIKSRTLMVAEPVEDGEGDADGEPSIAAAEPTDPRVELVQQLLDYQRYRIVSETLEDRRQAFIRQFPAQPSRADQEQPEDEAPILELDDAHVYDLYESYERIVASIDFTRLGDHRVEIDDTPAALYQEDLMDRLARTPDGRLTLQETFEGCPNPQRLGLFLATLELVRLRRIDVRQDDLLAEIAVELRQEEGTEAQRHEGTE